MSTSSAYPRARLSDIADVSGGVTLGRTVPEAASVELPYLRVANVRDGYIDTSDLKAVRVLRSEVDRYSLRKGDLLITEGGDFDKVGRGAVWDGRVSSCLHQNHLFRVRCHPGKALPKYLAAYLSSGEGRRYFLGIAKQTTNLASINSSQLKRMSVPLPDLDEQSRIVEVLCALDEHSRAIEATITKLRTVRHGVLASMMSSLASSEPKPGFVRAPLKRFVPEVEYGVSEALSADSSGTPILRMNNLRDGRVVVGDLRYLPDRVDSKLLLRDGDVLFNRTNSIEHVGKAALWRGELPEASFASYLVRLVPDRRSLLPEYLVEWLQHPLVRQRVRAISTVAVQQVNVNPTRLRDLEVDVPEDLNAQREVVDALAAFDGRIEVQLEEQEKLAVLKAGLTADLLQGVSRVG
ncbi:restriction endonuclease subunit S [Streptomyces sp. NPDC048109]|uniref:restriction endonuclease subunit S n=1 Tax=Streptomyces sp. NPDC048109 TaxID=3155482 RepID=UPI00342D8381